MKQWNPADSPNLHRTSPSDPHCPVYCGKECPPACPNHGRMYDGCHVCDCLHGPKDPAPHAPNHSR
jgi:hypothetical protein